MWQYVAIAAGTAIGAKILSKSDKNHHDVVEDTYDAIEPQLPPDASIYADHLSHRDEVESPHGVVDGLTHVPDVVVKSGISNSLLIEVETADSLAENGHDAKSQLEDFSKSGYRRVLVVQQGKSDVEAVRAFLDEIEDDLDGKMHVANPETVPKLL